MFAAGRQPNILGEQPDAVMAVCAATPSLACRAWVALKLVQAHSSHEASRSNEFVKLWPAHVASRSCLLMRGQEERSSQGAHCA